MRNSLILVLLLATASILKAQDIAWMLERAPVVSMVLARLLEKAPSFSARGEIKVFSKAEPIPSAASGVVESKSGDLRWEIKLADITSAQFSDSAKTLLKQVNGDRLLLLTQRRAAMNELVFSRAGACIEQALPAVKLLAPRAQASEVIGGHSCARERVAVRDGDGRSYELVVWRAKDLQKLPVQIQFAEAGETIRIRFEDIRFRPIPAQRFQLPAGLSKHETIEDLMQWVLTEKLKKRMGL
jgi:hypothetical protein